LRSLEPFPHEIGFNVLPQVDVFLDNGYTKEDWQLLEEPGKSCIIMISWFRLLVFGFRSLKDIVSRSPLNLVQIAEKIIKKGWLKAKSQR
jgi:hypothetical protein